MSLVGADDNGRWLIERLRAVGVDAAGCQRPFDGSGRVDAYTEFLHYWQQFGSRRLFATTAADRRGDMVMLNLFQLSDMKIVRHQKISGDFNPFDPEWVLYGEQLQVARMSQDIWDAQRLKLWMQQGGYCALCEQIMDSTDALDDHHIVYRMYGGSDALSNRVLLHPVCHRRVHALGLEVTKPVPVRGL